tara:strand:+ start:6343 stop:6849 length:507 start_codon:yes stop_codon:yes gene_type:complete
MNEETSIKYKSKKKVKTKVNLCQEFILETKINYKQGNVIVTSSNVSKDELHKIWENNFKDIRLRERFVALYLNQANYVLGYFLVGIGSTKGITIDIKHIIQTALQCNAQAIILCHNHPSGNINPSSADLTVTKSIKKAANLFDISVLDHIILTPDESKFYSFADEQKI